jgi:hypothetical protein
MTDPKVSVLRTEELHAEQVKMNHRKGKMTEEERKARNREKSKFYYQRRIMTETEEERSKRKEKEKMRSKKAWRSMSTVKRAQKSARMREYRKKMLLNSQQIEAKRKNDRERWRNMSTEKRQELMKQQRLATLKRETKLVRTYSDGIYRSKFKKVQVTEVAGRPQRNTKTIALMQICDLLECEDLPSHEEEGLVQVPTASLPATNVDKLNLKAVVVLERIELNGQLKR